MQSYETLERAKALIEDPSDWCQDALTQAKPGGGLQRCAYGALMATERRSIWADAGIALHEASLKMGKTNAVDVNNHLGHTATMQMFNIAIRSEKARLGVKIDLPEPLPAPKSNPRDLVEAL